MSEDGIREFQRRIEDIYHAKDAERGLSGTYMWFVEEIGELARSFLSGKAASEAEKAEFADCLAWLSTLAILAVIAFAPQPAAVSLGRALALRKPTAPNVIYEDESRYSYIAVKQADRKGVDQRHLLLDKLSRTRLNVVFYRNYAGLPCDRVRSLADRCFEAVVRPHLFNEAHDCIAEHRGAGRRLVLVTGSLDFIMEPLAKHLGADACIAPSLVEEGDRFTGELDGPPVGSSEKATRIKAFAHRESVDLAASYAYGDSIADLPMLPLPLGFGG